MNVSDTYRWQHCAQYAICEKNHNDVLRSGDVERYSEGVVSLRVPKSWVLRPPCEEFSDPPNENGIRWVEHFWRCSLYLRVSVRTSCSYNRLEPHFRKGITRNKQKGQRYGPYGMLSERQSDIHAKSKSSPMSKISRKAVKRLSTKMQVRIISAHFQWSAWA